VTYSLLAEMKNHMENTPLSPQSFDPRFIRWTALVTGIACAIGVALTAYIYRAATTSVVVQHVTDRVGLQYVRAESLESYLFFDPCLQLLIFLMSLSIAVFWRAFLQQLIKSARSRSLDSSFPRSGDPVIIYKLMCGALVVLALFEFFLTISNSIHLANYRPN
jgi:hypothetical protein